MAVFEKTAANRGEKTHPKGDGEITTQIEILKEIAILGEAYKRATNLGGETPLLREILRQKMECEILFNKSLAD